MSSGPVRTPSRPTPSLHEQVLERQYGSEQRAQAFYDHQVVDHLNERMRTFIARMDLMFLATADADGHCDSSVRAGPPGFVRVLDARRVLYPEYRGNGVMASLANIRVNPHISLLFIDFADTALGLHVNGRAHLTGPGGPPWPRDTPSDPAAERWVMVDVEEAYIHCSKHLPRMTRHQEVVEWGTDDPAKKGGDYFGVSADRRRSPASARP